MVAEVAGRIQFFEVVAEVVAHIHLLVIAEVADHIQFFEVVDILYYVVVMAEAHYFVPVLLEEPNEYTSLVAVEVYEQDQMELLELEFVC